MLLLASCGASDDPTAVASTDESDATSTDESAASAQEPAEAAAQEPAAEERPVIVATTNILGDVVENLVGDQFEVVTVMPVGADPHTFQASAQQVAQLGEADLVVANGGGF
jgi:zinc/manganese transport system substrate-binding protein